MDQSLAAAVGAALDAEFVEERPREPADAALPQSEFVEEPQELCHQAGAEFKWRAAHARPRRGRAVRRGRAAPRARYG